MANKLFVGNLSWDTNDGSLNEFFSQVGQVISANVVTDKFSGRSRGFGFVEMATDEEAEKAKQELNNKELDGRAITVGDARPQEPREGGGQRGSDRRDDRGGYRDNRRNR
ncbi:MAG: RNA-binding protein [Armatimonadetes bacterium]|nr:MAG: RNA-binding protein [Armatimonadota bacterium]